MAIIFPILAFVLGAIAGSFFNVVLLRKNTGESVVFGRSRCFSCGQDLAWYDNIPILSFLMLRGHCRRCGSKISPQYPIVEFLIGLLAVLVYLKFSALGSLASKLAAMLFYFSAFSSLFLVAAYDLRTKFIDSGFLFLFAVFAAVEALSRWGTTENLLNALIYDLTAAFAIALFFYALWRFSGGSWMGRGDTDVAFWISLLLGWPLGPVAFILSFWIGGFIGIFLLTLKKSRFTLKSELPFAPFLALSAFLVWFFSTGLIFIFNWLYF